RIIRRGRFLFRNKFLDPAARPRGARDRSGRAIFSASQSAKIRCDFGRTASTKNGRSSQSLSPGIFLADAKPLKGEWNRNLLASDQSIKGGGNQGDPASVSQCVSKCIGLGGRRSGLDHDGDQLRRLSEQSDRGGASAAVE